MHSDRFECLLSFSCILHACKFLCMHAICMHAQKWKATCTVCVQHSVMSNKFYVLKQVFRVKKTRGAPMGRPKLELLASNGVATFVMPFSITLNARHTHIKQTHTCIHRHTHTSHRHTHTCVVCVCVCVCTWEFTNLYMITPCNG